MYYVEEEPYDLPSYLISSCNIYSALESDYINDSIPLSEQKKLLQVCMDAILLDVYILNRIYERIPKPLLLKILNRAIETNRVLSIKYILERYPLEEFVFPVPACLKNCRRLLEHHKSVPPTVSTSIKCMKNNVAVICSTFATVISKNDPASSWRVLNFNGVLLELRLFQFLFEALTTDRSYCKQYMLKVSLIIHANEEYSQFIAVYNNPNIKIVLDGLYVDPDAKFGKQLIDMLNMIKAEDIHFLNLPLLTYGFDNLVGTGNRNNIKSLLGSIFHLQNLTSLSFTFIRDLLRDAIYKESLGRILYNLPNLKNLTWKRSVIGNHLQDLLMFNCCRKVEELPTKKTRLAVDKCCVIHRGKLQYLDLFDCFLHDGDLKCLKERPFCENVKYLDIGYNYNLELQAIVECLQTMTSNLVALKLSSLFRGPTNKISLLQLLEKFKALKFLLLGKIGLPESQFSSFIQALVNIPNLKEVRMLPYKDLFTLSQAMNQAENSEELLAIQSALKDKITVHFDE